jgi:membrane-bound lytic murein transglycosylase D
MISKRILEIYASRNIVINGNYKAIPIIINRHVQAEIDLFTKGREKRFFIDSYKRSGRYRNKIVSALREAGLPQELSWLPLIESGFKVNALSRSRALGMWQFIPSTGYKFGLSRNKFIDERMDPEKSTRAAIEYLKELHKIFGDWSTALAAYNCGEGRVLRLIRGQNINYLDNFWDLYQRLPRETARYVPRFLATLHILNNPEAYGLDRISVDPPLEYETVVINKQVHLTNVAKSIGVDRKILKELNPELRYQILPGDNYRLNIPPGNSDTLLAKIDQIPVSHPPQRAYVYHRVRHGESLSTIARKYRTSVRKIMRANNMRRSNYIVAGKRIKIPQRGYKTQTSQIIRKPVNGQALTHRVRKGDSLYILAKRYGTTTKKIQNLNHLKTTVLHIGQVLTIFPGKNTPPPAVDGLATYEVREGDSPFQIAKRHKMPLNRFLRLNQLYPESKIFPGQKVFIE